MKLGIVTPTRGDRPQFMEHRNWLMRQQTRQADADAVVDYPPEPCGKRDLVPRYKLGFQALFDEGCDLILCIEDDDWYAPNYLERMVGAWVRKGRPDMIGCVEHCYYHLLNRRYFIRDTRGISPMMMTGVTPRVLEYRWPAETHIALDCDLWRQNPTKERMRFKELPAVGIKHGIGVCAGIGHRHPNTSMNIKDDDYSWLRSTVDENSFEFYMGIAGELSKAKKER